MRWSDSIFAKALGVQIGRDQSTYKTSSSYPPLTSSSNVLATHSAVSLNHLTDRSFYVSSARMIHVSLHGVSTRGTKVRVGCYLELYSVWLVWLARYRRGVP